MTRIKMFSAVLAVSVGVTGFILINTNSVLGRQNQHQHQHPQATEKQSKEHQHGGMINQGQKIPAYYENVDGVKEVPKTLAPEQFTDPKTKQAYEVARDNPKLLMQMPCFCYCDKPGLDHKSLLSCFVDSHGANCDTCIDEAVMAAKLQKENLSIKEIREKIVAEFYKGN